MPTDFSTRFEGKTIIVTGAGSGIGRAATLRLLNEGARVVGADISLPRLEELKTETGTDHLVTVAGDLTKQETIDAIVDAAGVVDGIASVAGITDNWLPAAEMDDATWQRVFDINVTAPMRLTRAVLPQMIERGTGALAYVSSEAGFRSSISGAGYTSSKHALNGFVKSVAFYYGPKGVRANAVAPGGVNTNIDIAFSSSYALERTGKLLETMPTPSVEPEVVAKSLLWLLTDDAENINGAIIPTDGGWTTI